MSGLFEFVLFLGRCSNIKKENLINEQIVGKEFRVIDEKGNQLGILSRDEALDLADEKKLDLICIAPTANPPVCRILDYGKFRYELQKREKEAKKKQKTATIKEIRLSTFIEDHDLSVKANTAKKFLKDGDKIKVTLRFRGREKDYTSIGFDVMNRFMDFLGDNADFERKPKFEGRSLSMVIMPKNDKNKTKEIDS